MAERAYITPKVLKWARETAKISETDAAAKVSVKAEKILEWENGESQPTVNQAIKLAKSYQRPFAVLFLPEPPTDFQPLQDFRKSGSKELSTAVTFIIREIQKKQSWISQQNQEDEESRLPFVGKFTLKDSPKQIAQDILKTLEINPTNYGEVTPLKKWIDQAESKGIFISRSSFIHTRLKIDKAELQGFAIADPYAPFVFINSGDWGAPQLFTLVHELAHLWIAQTGISNNVDIEIKGKLHPVELFCNEIAANALMPEDTIKRISSNSFTDSRQIFRIAKVLGVSSFALIYRAFRLDLISIKQYNILKEQATIQFEEFLAKEAIKKAKQKKTPGGPSPYLLKLNRNSRLFTQIVLDGFNGGRIEPNLASSLLSTKSNKFHKLQERMYL
jgi:Zn-dependent peptidase ImmA (M78 family)/DNA-binding XRE family transcriptional regulator